MSTSSVSASVGACTTGLVGHLGEFIEALTVLGYAEQTRRQKRALVAPFVHWMEDEGVRTSDLNEARLITYLRLAPPRIRRGRNPKRVALEQFLEYLRDIGVTPRRPGPDLSPADVLVKRYVDHLRHVRGLAECSIVVYSPFVRAFAVALQLGESCDIEG